MPSALRLGFERRRKTGSHERWKTIPVHGGGEIGPPLFYKILAQLGVSAEEFRKLQ
jgi:predicted RNA binding protein YcfA (HicA-like mRNA interferase family)